MGLPVEDLLRNTLNPFFTFSFTPVEKEPRRRFFAADVILFLRTAVPVPVVVDDVDVDVVGSVLPTTGVIEDAASTFEFGNFEPAILVVVASWREGGGSR